MLRLMFITLMMFSSAFSASCKQAENPISGETDLKLVWSDEFEADGLPDTSKWNYDVGGHGWGNNELEYYTERRLKNARVEDGHLIIEAHREPWEGSDYTSARLVTKGKGDWTYGRFEIRAKLPSGRGTWPAIWMLASGHTYGETYWPNNGELDIMEHVGYEPDVVHGTVHTKAFFHSNGTQQGSEMTIPTARTDFNVYAMEWASDEVRFYINDTKYFTFKNLRLMDEEATYEQWPFDHPFHLLLNIAVGGSWGGQQGVDPDIWPQRMVVDYVRVYQEN